MVKKKERRDRWKLKDLDRERVKGRLENLTEKESKETSDLKERDRDIYDIKEY